MVCSPTNLRGVRLERTQLLDIRLDSGFNSRSNCERRFKDSSPYISPATPFLWPLTTFLWPLHFSGHYVSPAPTFLEEARSEPNPRNRIIEICLKDCMRSSHKPEPLAQVMPWRRRPGRCLALHSVEPQPYCDFLHNVLTLTSYGIDFKYPTSSKVTMPDADLQKFRIATLPAQIRP
jgi:hypothetical protein